MQSEVTPFPAREDSSTWLSVAVFTRQGACVRFLLCVP
jgi:hypothetical protein